jgi:hypothetical protein
MQQTCKIIMGFTNSDIIRTNKIMNIIKDPKKWLVNDLKINIIKTIFFQFIYNRILIHASAPSLFYFLLKLKNIILTYILSISYF